ncbi:Hypothetical protein I595_1736 [Croceitalea dokdonensis DOKDO 023]|uniref:Uncharacterized protein n=1 Tax=Croceitalea dokdonensis DOKDO 023 TaxID=1300341 RepID=A0A0P7AFJ5_9FLAO|nr:Hypothetical protein I595_1736 [Croceitalea dokdonensis DOKDO 023]
MTVLKLLLMQTNIIQKTDVPLGTSVTNHYHIMENHES